MILKTSPKKDFTGSTQPAWIQSWSQDRQVPPRAQTIGINNLVTASLEVRGGRRGARQMSWGDRDRTVCISQPVQEYFNI